MLPPSARMSPDASVTALGYQRGRAHPAVERRLPGIATVDVEDRAVGDALVVGAGLAADHQQATVRQERVAGAEQVGGVVRHVGPGGQRRLAVGYLDDIGPRRAGRHLLPLDPLVAISEDAPVGQDVEVDRNLRPRIDRRPLAGIARRRPHAAGPTTRDRQAGDDRQRLPHATAPVAHRFFYIHRKITPQFNSTL